MIFFNVIYSVLNCFHEIVQLPEGTGVGQKQNVETAAFTPCDGVSVQVCTGGDLCHMCNAAPFPVVPQMVVNTRDSAFDCRPQSLLDTS